MNITGNWEEDIMGKQKDYLAMETDGKFFDDLREMERQILIKHEDWEGLAELEAEYRELDAEAELEAE